MSISSTGLYDSATIVNSDLFNGVSDWKEQATTLTTSYLTTTLEHRTDISLNLSKINDISGNKIPALESDISGNLSKINNISGNIIPALESDNSSTLSKINNISSNTSSRIGHFTKYSRYKACMYACMYVCMNHMKN
jgi:hypothetical protein